MLDRISNDNTDIIRESQSLESIKAISGKNPYKADSKIYFIDEFDVSSEALEKYQKEVDIKEFSKFFDDEDEYDSYAKVIQDAMSGKYSIENDEFLNSLISNKDFLNEVFKEI